MVDEEKSFADSLRRVFEGESRIFRDAQWLQPLFDPPGGKPLFRDGDLRDLASYVGEAIRTGSG